MFDATYPSRWFSFVKWRYQAPQGLLAAAGRSFADEADVPESVSEVVDVGVRSPECQVMSEVSL